MTTTEFSNEFDTLYNNVMSNQAPGIDDYEKSVFLTRAQEEIIKNYFNPRSNKLQQGFDDNEKRQIDFSEITKVADITSNTIPSGYTTLDSRGVMFSYPVDTFIIINESVRLLYNGQLSSAVVVPITFREYDRLMSKPYKEPLPRQCWKLIQGNATTPVNPSGQSIVVELIPRTSATINSYKVRYVKRPQPIILTSLAAQGLSINGINTISECELNPIIHREILDRAVELAKIAYQAGDPASHIQVNQRNE